MSVKFVGRRYTKTMPRKNAVAQMNPVMPVAVPAEEPQQPNPKEAMVLDFLLSIPEEDERVRLRDCLALWGAKLHHRVPTAVTVIGIAEYAKKGKK